MEQDTESMIDIENEDKALIDKTMQTLSRRFFKSALTALKDKLSKSDNNTKSDKPNNIKIYIVCYDKDSDEHQKRANQLMETLQGFLGEENVFCDAIGMGFGEGRAQYVGQMEKCHYIIVLGTRALKGAYDELIANTLSNVVLTMVLTKLIKHKTRIIPFYLEGDQVDAGIPFFLQNSTPEPMRNDNEYHNCFFPLLKILLAKDQRDEINKAEKQFKRLIEGFTNSPPKMQLDRAKKMEQEKEAKKKRMQDESFAEIDRLLFGQQKVTNMQTTPINQVPDPITIQPKVTPSPTSPNLIQNSMGKYQDMQRAYLEGQVKIGQMLLEGMMKEFRDINEVVPPALNEKIQGLNDQIQELNPQGDGSTPMELT